MALKALPKCTFGVEAKASKKCGRHGLRATVFSTHARASTGSLKSMGLGTSIGVCGNAMIGLADIFGSESWEVTRFVNNLRLADAE
jgi:hypothetical protein